MATIYHVAKVWDGGDLLSLQSRSGWSDEVAGEIASRWPDCDPWAYYSTEGRYVHCHATPAEALDYRDEWCPGGVVLEIDADDLDVQVGAEYPHPVVAGSIPAWAIVSARRDATHDELRERLGEDEYQERCRRLIADALGDDED